MSGIEGQEPSISFWIRLLDPAYLEALAKVLWPMVAVIIVLLLRSHLRKLIDRLKKAKAFGAEVELRDDVLELRTATVKTLKHKPVIKILEAASQPEAPRYPTTEPQTMNQVVKPTMTEETDPFAEPLGKEGRAIVGEHARLLTRVTQDDVLREAQSKLKTDPNLAISTLAIALERALKSAAVAGGVKPGHIKQDRISEYARYLSKKYDLGPYFEVAVARFWEARNTLAHKGTDSLPLPYIRKMAESGISLLEITLRLPVHKFFIDEAGIEIFSDKSCTQRVPDLEGLLVIHAALPGMTGHIELVATRNTGFYPTGGQVTYEWLSEEIKPWPLWGRRASGLAYSIHKRNPFNGDRIDDLI